MTEKDDARQVLKKELLRRLSEDRRVYKVLLLGSSVNGGENELSDIDVCIVMKDDLGLKQILGEVGVLFSNLGSLISYYNYSPYHFYVVYDGLIPLDIYLISSSLYHILKSGRSKEVYSSQGDLSSIETSAIQVVVSDLLLQLYIRNFRLLSKLRKQEYPTLVFILNSIREENIIPLLRLVYGLDIPHQKAVKLGNFPEEAKELYINSYAIPTEESCLSAIKAVADLVLVIASKASATFELSAIIRQAEKARTLIMAYG